MNEDIKSTSNDIVDVAGLFKRSWALFAAKPLEHVVVSLIVVVLGTLTLGILFGPLIVGQIQMIEKQQDGQPITIGDVFGGFNRFAPAFVVTLVFFVCLFIGLSLLVLPGLLVVAAWSFSWYFVALRGSSATEALGGSWQLLKTQALSVVVVILLVAVANTLAGTVIFATLLTTPLSAIFATFAFQDMLTRTPVALGKA